MKILKNSKEADIIASIRTLLDELARHISSDAPGKRISTEKAHSSYFGASGGIKLLFEEGYFKGVKSLPEVIARLRQEGFNYPRNTISMGLLRAVRNRILVRLPAEGRKGREKWVYIIRK